MGCSQCRRARVHTHGGWESPCTSSLHPGRSEQEAARLHHITWNFSLGTSPCPPPLDKTQAGRVECTICWVTAAKLLGFSTVPFACALAHNRVMNWNDGLPYRVTQHHTLPPTFNSVLYDGFILFFEWLHFCFLMQSQATVGGQALSYIPMTSSTAWSGPQLYPYIKHSLVRQGQKSEAHCRTAVFWEARLMSATPATPATRHPSSAFTVQLPPVGSECRSWSKI